jgi:hypothetical protein
MPHNEDKLTPADPRDLAEAVALALRFFEGRNRNRDADAFRAALAGERVVRHLSDFEVIPHGYRTEAAEPSV